LDLFVSVTQPVSAIRVGSGCFFGNPWPGDRFHVRKKVTAGDYFYLKPGRVDG